MNLRAQAEIDLQDTLEDPNLFGMPVVLVGPDGLVYETVYGRVVYDTVSQDENGSPLLDDNPAVTLRRSSLERVPLPGEKWSVKIPESPIAGADVHTYLLERAAQHGKSIGFVTLYLRRAEQSES